MWRSGGVLPGVYLEMAKRAALAQAEYLVLNRVVHVACGQKLRVQGVNGFIRVEAGHGAQPVGEQLPTK